MQVWGLKAFQLFFGMLLGPPMGCFSFKRQQPANQSCTPGRGEVTKGHLTAKKIEGKKGEMQNILQFRSATAYPDENARKLGFTIYPLCTKEYDQQIFLMILCFSNVLRRAGPIPCVSVHPQRLLFQNAWTCCEACASNKFVPGVWHASVAICVLALDTTRNPRKALVKICGLIRCVVSSLGNIPQEAFCIRTSEAGCFELCVQRDVKQNCFCFYLWLQINVKKKRTHYVVARVVKNVDSEQWLQAVAKMTGWLLPLGTVVEA
jgi:hypothetical protein